MFEAGVLTEKHRKGTVWDPRVRLATLWKLLKREEWLEKKIWKESRQTAATAKVDEKRLDLLCQQIVVFSCPKQLNR